MISYLLLIFHTLFSLIPYLFIMFCYLFPDYFFNYFFVPVYRINNKLFHLSLKYRYNFLECDKDNTESGLNRTVNDEEYPIMIIKKDNHYSLFIRLLEEDILNTSRFQLIKIKENDISLHNDMFDINYHNQDIIYLDNKPYIDVQSSMEFIKMNGYIDGFGNVLQKKISISDYVAVKESIPGNMFSIMVISLIIQFCFAITRYNGPLIWHLFSLISIYFSSIIHIFEMNTESYLFREIGHLISTVFIFIIGPITNIYIFNNPLMNLICYSIMTFIIIFMSLMLFNLIRAGTIINKECYRMISATPIMANTSFLLEMAIVGHLIIIPYLF